MGLLIQRDGDTIQIEAALPVIPLRDVVVFPFMVIPLLVGRDASVAALEEAMVQDRFILLIPQRDGETANPGPEDLYQVGAVARILQMVRLPNNTIKVLVEGLERARVIGLETRKEHLQAEIELFPLTGDEEELRTEAVARKAVGLFEEYVHLNKRLPDEVLSTIQNVSSKVRLAHLLASHLLLRMSDKEALLEIPTLEEFFRSLIHVLTAEIEILKIERKIEGEVKNQVLKNQKEFYLQEQLKAIHKELGDSEDSADEIEELQEKLRTAGLSPEAREKAEREIRKLARMSALSPEATVVRNYLDWLLSIPWKKRTRDTLSVEKVERVLEADHYGLEKAKERIVEYIAVLRNVGSMRGPILCFVGPPGGGKTSLGKSIGRALGRKFVRISLGGIRDEAEIRGHRRTYIGSLPGRLIQAMKKAGTVNPVILLDEVDKMSVDFRGDPAAALLEALDPEQNHAFSDHYLEVDYDLSQVLFITTANVLYAIPPALRDRMEVIHLSGYIEGEKVEIARRFLIPKQLKANGLTPDQVRFTRKAIQTVLREYTREAGVRNLEREIGSLLRKVSRRVAQGTAQFPFTVGARKVRDLLGAPRYTEPEWEKEDQVGVAAGLAWTEVGGEVLSIEASVVPGRGRLSLTGKLGEVMKESAEAALSYTRSRTEALGIEPDFYRKCDIHIHIPEGAIPKDGPSAGIAIAAALISALRKVPVRHDVTMTGEITLRGRVLPIGGLKEKSVAALRAGFPTMVVPRRNSKDLEELPPEVRKGMRIVTVRTMDEVLEHAFRIPLMRPATAIPLPLPRASGEGAPLPH